MWTRLAPALALALVLLLATALPALAMDDGEGLVGETDDKIITFSSLVLVALFPLFVIGMSLLQHRLEKRKEERQAADARRRPGW